MATNHIVMFSGGTGSWVTARRVAARVGTSGMTLLFADTLIEDEDTYRGLIKMAANVFGRSVHWVADLSRQALALTPVEADDLPRRKAELAALREATKKRIPQLAWIADGRTPWEVFRDERFIGNTRIDPCSKILKRKLMDRWRDEHCDPSETVCYVGIDWSESHRFTGGAGKPGIRARMAAMGWTFEAPLCEKPWLISQDTDRMYAEAGIRKPRLYVLGFPHNNCGGFCVKAGHRAFRLLHRVLPQRFAYHAGQEREAMQAIGTDATVLRDRDLGASTRLTLQDFAKRCAQPELFEQADELFGEFGGCGCAIDDGAGDDNTNQRPQRPDEAARASRSA
jgi:hypothetical protein